ncbi:MULTISPECIES: maleate cis-trans isomerase family protein [Paracoccus]|jgi:maleate isomerase|uniref:Asp/Glu racemase n=2 Tax=Paracoccus denitrificans TaxID=266 RepID=A1BAY7_PARDP|nr:MULTISPECIES: aspartate/glutamate racemase family protein [Paracoccus]ABL72681.1 Asp/Glu racemase [Paracoccus denitrificans PD1222]MDK8871025.1 aspartate/glutamate racemase family protein [Paracoccus sp. SSJ]QAR29656.1 Asp/Glu/hydantoin racemase [Paracoccus denitrificans]UFS68442.1 aspartate/glutamate racemase family protein [Paracoccus denitrificans]UPV98572.1 aspartate/glutamate racemase family protein [Paracoccus denitrificans]
MQNDGNVGLAMLTPSSNTVVEPLTSAMAWPLYPDVSVHFGRFRVTRIALDEGSNSQFTLEPILAAADLLADAKPAIIAWNGTSASWLGFDTDDRLCAAITKRTGIPATSAILSLNRLLAEMGVKRLGLVTPYTRDVQQRIIANYAAIGIETVAERHSGRSDNHSFAEVTEEEIREMCLDVAQARPDAIAIVCTNMRGPLIAPELERQTGIPILDSVAFTLWGCLRETGVPMDRLAGYGQMFVSGRDQGLCAVPAQ